MARDCTKSANSLERQLVENRVCVRCGDPRCAASNAPDYVRYDATPPSRILVSRVQSENEGGWPNKKLATGHVVLVEQMYIQLGRRNSAAGTPAMNICPVLAAG